MIFACLLWSKYIIL